MNPFTSDGAADLSLNQVPWTTLVYTEGSVSVLLGCTQAPKSASTQGSC
jgi:hypothetical protein